MDMFNIGGSAKRVADIMGFEAEKNAQPFKHTKELEKQTREIKEQTSIVSSLKEITEQNISSSQEYNEASKRISKTSLWVSAIAVMISLAFGVSDFISSNNWQNEQIQQLKNQNKLLQQMNSNLKKIK